MKDTQTVQQLWVTDPHIPSSCVLHHLSGSVVHPFLFMMPPLSWSLSQTLLPRSSQWPVCPSPQLQFWSCSSLPCNTVRALVVRLCIWLKVLQCSCGQVQAPRKAWGPLLPSSFPQPLSSVCVQPLSWASEFSAPSAQSTHHHPYSPPASFPPHLQMAPSISSFQRSQGRHSCLQESTCDQLNPPFPWPPSPWAEAFASWYWTGHCVRHPPHSKCCEGRNCGSLFRWFHTWRCALKYLWN